MNANEKQMRYQSLAKINQMKRDGAKPASIERLRRSIGVERGAGTKGQVHGGRRQSNQE
jgi:hypothetical protein